MSAQEGFALHPRLAAGGVEVGRLDLCVVLLKSDARWPWAILVPKRPTLTELHDLTAEDGARLMAEICAVSRAVAAEAGIEKINVAALGNQVAQLHVHVIGRCPGDAAWPDPVFNAKGEKRAYAADGLAALLARWRMHLGLA